MTTASVERFERTPRFREAFETKLKRARLAIREYFSTLDLESYDAPQSVSLDTLSTDTSDGLAFAYTSLSDDPDQRLAFLVDVSKKYDTETVPKILVTGIAEAADHLIDLFPPEVHTDKNLSYLARASDITGNPEYLQAALEYADTYGVKDKLVPYSIEALHLAAMNGISFDAAYAQSKDAHRKDLPMRLKSKTPKSPSHWHSADNSQIPMSEYEYLFAKDTHHPIVVTKEAQSDTEPLDIDNYAA